MSPSPDSREVFFSDDLSLLILRFLLFFFIMMFVVGCSLVFLSMESNKEIPLIFFLSGVCVPILILIERKYRKAGTAFIDLESGLIYKKQFCLRHFSGKLTDLDSILVQRVIIRKKVHLYSIFFVLRGKYCLMGHETDLKNLERKIELLGSVRDVPVYEDDVFKYSYMAPSVKKIFFIMFPIVIFFLLLASALRQMEVRNIKFLIVILIPMGYFIFFYLKKGSEKK
ncbi:MAG: hypothetical protein C4541_03030 [Candidatus Auribacter fodinae]|jgi:hypothetical protein|uniref:Uncharacterized protein n=1 Tax=Candidatus Auribacter fodinae TaxID=2093366 RepID=A0A3A4RE32_9BACT|nr:MAG: hypothetical protein C4541_03030 [Candidatus Auribacter fodinae]